MTEKQWFLWHHFLACMRVKSDILGAHFAVIDVDGVNRKGCNICQLSPGQRKHDILSYIKTFIFPFCLRMWGLNLYAWVKINLIFTYGFTSWMLTLHSPQTLYVILPCFLHHFILPIFIPFTPLILPFIPTSFHPSFPSLLSPHFLASESFRHFLTSTFLFHLKMANTVTLDFSVQHVSIIHWEDKDFPWEKECVVLEVQ